MKIFVTGATGFVGGYFVRKALASGHYVRAIRRSASLMAAIDSRLEWLDVSLDAVGSRHFEGCDAFVHFAAAGVSPKHASREELTYWNVTVPQLLLEKAYAAGIRRVVIAGTFAEYGLSANHYDLIPPCAPLIPTTSYASSKAACFVTCYATAIELGLELSYLRVFSAFGDGQYESNFWPALRKAALEGRDFEMTPGEQIRDYIHVEQVVLSFLYAVTRADVIAGSPVVLNVGSGVPVSMRVFAETWWQKLQATGVLKVGALPYRPNEVMRFVPLITDYRAMGTES
jgi:nucleoside-diphosphate-sugar epimerase